MKTFPVLATLFVTALAFSACSDDDTTPANDSTVADDTNVADDSAVADDTNVADAIELTVDITYPADAVGAGQMPALAVYDRAQYPDLTQRPTAMPLAALLGTEATNSLSGKVLDLMQTKPFPFEAGKAYVITAGVAAAGGMPSFLDNTYWIAQEVTLQQADTLTIPGDDSGWAQ